MRQVPAYGYVSVSVAPVRPEEGQVVGETTVVVFQSAVGLNVRSSVDSGQATVSGEAFRIDLREFETAYAKGRDMPDATGRPSYLRDTLAGQTLTVEVAETVYDRQEIGDRYDFINKVTQKVYRYTERHVPVASVGVTTDAQGRFTYAFPVAERSSYRVMVRSTDSEGRVGTETLYVYGTRSEYSFNGAYLRAEGENSTYASPRLEIGEQARITMHRGDAPLASGGKNRYLFYEQRQGLRRHVIQDGPTYALTFGEEHVPNVSFGGVYFNGFTYVQALWGPTLAFKPDARRLTIDLTTEAERYEPGDDVIVRIEVRDAAGKPVRAEVNVSAVDEAVFAVRDFYQYQGDILGRVYRWVPGGVATTYASHQYPLDAEGPGGRGGGGGPRLNFADVAFFGSVRTDVSGRAEVRFKVPDNLTSWRLTSFGVTDDLKAGSGLGEVVVGLPFFVDVSMNRDYLESDRPMVRVRAFGTALTRDDDVVYRVSAPSLGISQTASGKGFEGVWLPLMPLVPGEHEITVEAVSGDRKDALVREVNVVSSRLLAPSVQFYESVSSGAKFQGARSGQTRVTFIDAGRGRFYPLLQRLAFAPGERVDQALARVLARDLLREYFDESLPNEPFRPQSYVVQRMPPRPAPGSPPPQSFRNWTGIAILPVAEPDLVVTARVAALAPDLFGRDTLRTSLEAVVNDRGETPERYAIALYGLAALGDPVLLSLQSLAGQQADLGWRGRLYLALAFQSAGDDAAAASLLDVLIADHDEDAPPYRRLRVGADEDDVLEATSLAAVLASALGDPRADAYLRYVQAHYTQDILVSLEELSYVKAAVEKTPAGRVRFDYVLDGRRETVTLDKGAARSLSLTAEQLRGLRVERIDGKLAASTMFLAPLATGGEDVSPDLTVARTYLVATPGAAPAAPAVVRVTMPDASTRPAQLIPENALVQVVIDVKFGPQAPDGTFVLTDVLPSGLKPVTSPFFITGGDYLPPAALPGRGLRFPIAIEGQRVTFCVSRNVSQVIYYARPTARGDFVVEPALVSHSRAPSVFNYTDPLVISIR